MGGQPDRSGVGVDQLCGGLKFSLGIDSLKGLENNLEGKFNKKCLGLSVGCDNCWDLPNHASTAMGVIDPTFLALKEGKYEPWTNVKSRK